MTEALLDQLPGARVLIVGDVMLDAYLWGEVARISPEAPIPVVELQRREHLPGGAANVAQNIVALEGTALLAGIVGEDDDGVRLREALGARGVDDAGVLSREDRRTTVKTRVIARTQHVVRVDQEDRGPLPAPCQAALLDAVRGLLGGCDVVVLSDYAKGVVSPEVAQAVIGAAREAGKAVVVDPKGHDFGKYHGATVITPNLNEAQVVAGPSDDHAALAAGVAEQVGGAHVVLTLGPQGMLLKRADGGDDVRIPVEARAVSDVTGAGDTVVATLAVALARGIELEDAVRLANRAAAGAVAHVGAHAVTLDELRALHG